LTVGAVLITGWLLSTMRPILAAPGRRWAMPAVVATAGLAVAGWFAAWFAYRQFAGAWTPALGDPPDPGGAIGWYSHLTQWAGVELGPLDYVYGNPLTLPGLTLVWLVPILLAWRRKQPVNLRPALITGLAGGVIVLALAAALPYLAKVALPLDARHFPRSEPDFNTVPFSYAYHLGYIACAVLAQAVVAAVVAARARRHRPALTVLAVSLTAAIAVVGLFWVTLPISRCIDLYGEGVGRCFVNIDAGYATIMAEWIAIKGIIVAIPAALLGAAIGVLLRRGRVTADGLGTANDHPQETARPRRVGPALAVAVIGLLVAASATVTVLGLDRAYRVWLSWSV
jgi:hypothetical protein